MAHILLIEDNDANLALVRYLLSHAGHRLSCAQDGLQGVALALNEVPDLVLCDLQLPGLDGYGVLARLRADPRTTALPVIAVTAFSMPDDLWKVRTAGFNAYFSKPIEPERFVTEVEAFLPRPGPAA